MEVNQFAIYQLKIVPENRDIRFRSYEALQKNKKRIQYGSYEQKYLGWMLPADTPGSIRERFNKQIPRNFDGHSISVSDVLVLNKNGEVTAYYIEKEGFTMIAGFIRNGSCGALISYDTTDFHIKGKEGSWLAYDSIMIDGKEFFLMEHTTYGKDAANVVLDEEGKVVVEQAYHGFDDTVKKQINEYLHPMPFVQEPEKLPMENWQKYYENGEYLRSAEMTEEQNYNMIDGRMNNLPSKPKKMGKRISVLDRLHLKLAEIEKKSGKSTPHTAVENDMERRRK